jgi:uncharacterized protein YndB with AHSA1/START domain
MTGHVIHLDRLIDASPEQVWRVLTDIEHSADILRSVENVQVQDQHSAFDVGTRWRENRALMGHKGSEELEVVEAQEPSHFAVRTTREKDVVTITYTLTPLKTGTRLSLTLVDDMHERGVGGAIAWALWGELSLHSTRRMLEHDLEDIASAAEKAVTS